jgi:glycosyltransferase involved in cell wall biosynthesis
MGCLRRVRSARGERLLGIRATVRLARDSLVAARSVWAGQVPPQDFGALGSEASMSYRPVMMSTGREAGPHTPVQLSVVVPIHNNADLATAMVGDLLAALSASRLVAQHEVILVDDASDEEEAIAIRGIARRESLHLIVNDENLGYLRTVNRAARDARYDTLLILNTDVRFAPDAIQRGLEVMSASDSDIVSLADHATLKHLGLRAGSWQEADRALGRSPHWIPACTATGYFMFWRRRDASVVPFDETLGHGYGEDTDLHYRTLAAGGGQGRDRTADTTIFSRVLYQLSYLTVSGPDGI